MEEKAERVKELKVANDNKKAVSSRASISFSYKRKAIGTEIQNLCIQSQTEPQPGEGSWTHNPTPSQGWFLGKEKRVLYMSMAPGESPVTLCKSPRISEQYNWSFIAF